MQHEQYGQPYHRIAPSPLTSQERNNTAILLHRESNQGTEKMC